MIKNMKYLILGLGILMMGCTSSPVLPESLPPVGNEDTGCIEVYEPVCASYQVQCITTPCPPIEQTYANECLAREAGAGILYKGLCGEAQDHIDEVISPILPTGNFSYEESEGFSGNAYIYGYIEIVSIPESYCQENCTMYQGVFINALKSSSDSFQEFLERHRGNAYVGENKVMIGCLKERKIFYDNNSNEFRRKSFEINEIESQGILSATIEDPRIFRIMKLPLSWGSGTPACYSHFAEVEIVAE